MSNIVTQKRPILVAESAAKETIENEDYAKAVCTFFENHANLTALIENKEVLMDYNAIMACLESNTGKTLVVLKETKLNRHLIPDSNENTLFLNSTEVELLLAPFKNKFAYFDMFVINKCPPDKKKPLSPITTVAYKSTQLLSITLRTEKQQKKTSTANTPNGNEDTKKGICLKRRKNITNTK